VPVKALPAKSSSCMTAAQCAAGMHSNSITVYTWMHEAAVLQPRYEHLSAGPLGTLATCSLACLCKTVHNTNVLRWQQLCSLQGIVLAALQIRHVQAHEVTPNYREAYASAVAKAN
jgi:hypothetical protein